jgi:hypothetical protein
VGNAVGKHVQGCRLAAHCGLLVCDGPCQCQTSVVSGSLVFFLTTLSTHSSSGNSVLF